ALSAVTPPSLCRADARATSATAVPPPTAASSPRGMHSPARRDTCRSVGCFSQWRPTMTSPSDGLLRVRLLVTCATGRLASHVCRALLDSGYEVRATDQRFVVGFPVRVELGDLRDEHFVYRLLEGCDAVVHLGNHPNAYCGPSRQRLLAENVAMNA